LLSLWAYLLLVNVVGLALMGFDKVSAKADSERVPELWFFLISLAGGFIGVVLGIFVFHHKISKPSFQLKMGVAAILAILILFFLARGR
jgi:uncharacterized membrane protein YsdA (DUF1294 family)